MCPPLKTRKPSTHTYNMSHFLDFPLKLHDESKVKKKKKRKQGELSKFSVLPQNRSKTHSTHAQPLVWGPHFKASCLPLQP